MKYIKGFDYIVENKRNAKRLLVESVTDAYNNLEKIFGTDQETMDIFQGIEDNGTVKDMIEFIDEFGNEEMLYRYGIRSTAQIKKLAKTIMNESVNEDRDTIDSLNKMANTDLERIADYADMIKDRMSQGQQLDAWMYSKISDSVKNLNSVHDTMDGNDGITEAKLSTVHKAAKKGSYPAVIVVVQDGKVIHQEPVSTPDVAPAAFNVMQEKYPKALLHLEDKTGKRLFSESVNEGKKTQTLEVVYQGPIKKYRGDLYKARKEDNGTYTVFLDEPGRQIVEVPASDVRIVESSVTENYEVIYSDGVSHLSKFRSETQALDFMKKEIASNKKLRDIAVYKPGMHSTTQTELVVKFWGEGSYLDNVSKRDKNLAAKKLEESSVTEARYNKKSLLKKLGKADDAIIQTGNGQEYVIYNPNNGNQDNTDMWDDKVIFALDQDGEEHEIKYSDIVSYNESRKINLKAAHLSSEEYQKAKKLKDFDKEDWEWNSKSGLYDRVNEASDGKHKHTDHLEEDMEAMWKKAYGEKFATKYPGVAKIIRQRKITDKREIARIWQETYGENFKEEYPAMWDMLSK